MNFKIDHTEFNKGITEVCRIVSSKVSNPILTGVKIIANTEGLLLIGSNSDIFIEKAIPISERLEVFQTGSVVVSGKYLGEIIKSLPGDIYVHKNNNQSVTIHSEDIVTKLNCLDVEEYPPLPAYSSSNTFKIASDEFIHIIKRTVFAASKSDTRPVLTGANFLFQKDLLTCAATNSHRLALIKHKISAELDGSFIVPSSTLRDFVQLFANYNSEIDVFVNETTIIFKSDCLTLFSKLIEGNYPDISSLVSQQAQSIVTLNTKKFLKGIKRASIFSSESRNNNIKIQVENDSQLKISSKSAVTGEMEEKQPIKRITGENKLDVTFDGNFLSEALEAIEEDEVNLCFNGALRPILIKPVGNDSHLQLVSPIRT